MIRIRINTLKNERQQNLDQERKCSTTIYIYIYMYIYIYTNNISYILFLLKNATCSNPSDKIIDLGDSTSYNVSASKTSVAIVDLSSSNTKGDF